ncbi:hypothetical protein JHK85_023167 [Glycine max]|nr:hypothetical protein JHK85_023167 [Glycine max]KAG5026786.1 hypothetical protein JHK86_022700 [Glycine max]
MCRCAAPPLSSSCVAVNEQAVNPDSHFRLCHAATLKDGKTLYTLEGVDSSSLANKVAKVAGSINLGEVASHAILRMAAGDAVLETLIQQLVDSNPVMLFMNIVVSQVRDEDTSGLEDDVKRGLMPPEDVGAGTANALLGEIAQSGVVDSSHQRRIYKFITQSFSLRIYKVFQDLYNLRIYKERA